MSRFISTLVFLLAGLAVVFAAAAASAGDCGGLCGRQAFVQRSRLSYAQPLVAQNTTQPLVAQSYTQPLVAQGYTYVQPLLAQELVQPLYFPPSRFVQQLGGDYRLQVQQVVDGYGVQQLRSRSVERLRAPRRPRLERSVRIERVRQRG